MIELLRPGDHAAVFCTAQRSTVWRGLVAAVLLTKHDGSSFSSFSGSKVMFMLSAAPSDG